MTNHLHVQVQDDPDIMMKFTKKTHNLLLITQEGYEENQLNNMNDIDYTQIFFEVDTNTNVRATFSGNCVLPLLIRYNDQVSVPFEISDDQQTAQVFADLTGIKALNELQQDKSVVVMGVDTEGYSLGYLKTQELVGIEEGYNGAILCLGFNPKHPRQYSVNIQLIENDQKDEDQIVTQENYEERFFGNTVTIVSLNQQETTTFSRKFSLEIQKELEIFLQDFSSELYVSLVNEKHEKFLDIDLHYKTLEGEKKDKFTFSNGFQQDIQNYDEVKILVKNIGNSRTEFELSVKNLIKVQTVNNNDEEGEHSFKVVIIIIIIIIVLLFLALVLYGIYRRKNKDVYKSEYQSKVNKGFERFETNGNQSQNERLNQRHSDIQENNTYNKKEDSDSSDSESSKDSEEEYNLDYKENQLYRI